MAIALAPSNGHGRQLPDRTHLGDRMEIAAIRQRMASMMQLPPDVPDDVIWAAAQLSAAHRLDPFIGEIYIIPIGKKPNAAGEWIEQYRAHVGIKGLRTVARRQANFITDLAVMDATEVKAYRRDLYDANDIGVRCTLWRLDVARECKDAGIPYRPTIGVGFWRQNAQKRKDGWQPDNIPNTWTAQQVAEKRAEINAIKQAFDLALDVADPATADDEDTIDVMQRRIDQREIEQKPVIHTETATEDGLFYTVPANGNGQKRVVEPSTGEILQPAPGSPQDEASVPATAQARPFPDGDPFEDDDLSPLPDFDNPFDAEAPEPPPVALDYSAVAGKLTGNAATLVDWAKSKHAGSDGPATPAQYRMLSGVLDTLLGHKQSHNAVLGVLIGRAVTSGNPPGIRLVKLLLDYLVRERTETIDGQETKVANPTYRQDVADTLKAIWQAAQTA
jgi:hypothetical protein